MSSTSKSAEWTLDGAAYGPKMRAIMAGGEPQNIYDDHFAGYSTLEPDETDVDGHVAMP